MAENDEPKDTGQSQPENQPSQGRPRGRRWSGQNRSGRGQNRDPRPSAENQGGQGGGLPQASQPPEAQAQRSQGSGRRKNRPPRNPSGEGGDQAARAQNPPREKPAGQQVDGRPQGGQNRGRRRGGQNQAGGQNRPPRPAAETASGQPDGRNQNRPQRQQGDNQPRSKGRGPRRPDGTPAAQEASRSNNAQGAQNQPRRRRNLPAGQAQNRSTAGASPQGAPADRTQRRRPDGATGRQPSRRSGRPQGQTSNTGFRPEGEYHAPSVPRKARGGIRAQTENGEFGRNWWAKRWLLAMERLMDGARLQRGRRYAKMGQVLSMSEANGGIVAKVQGSRPVPYKVNIRVSPLSDEQWDKVLDVLADQAIFTAQLLAGEMPADIEDAFNAAGVSLFPARGGDLMTDCSCPDWANPCKHIAATHYILGDRFDEDPFLIFRMRGRDQEAILQGLRQRRAGTEEPPVEEPLPVEPDQPLDADLAHYWELGSGLADFSVNVQPAQIELPLLKRLGQPDFARHLPLERELGPAYEAISQAALFLAFSDISREASDNGSEPS